MERNYSIDTLRTYSAILVIMIHVSAEYVVLGMNNNTFDTSFWIANVFDSFSRISVPIFVLISGRFLIGRNESFLQFYKKRVSRILIPIVVWTVLYLAYRLVVNITHNNLDLDALLKSTIEGRPFYHMWYLYMIIGLYLVTPILNELVKHLSKRKLWYFVIMLFLVGFVNSTYNYFFDKKPTFIVWFIDYVGYFFLGFLVKDNQKKIPNYFLTVLYILSSGTIVVLSYFTAKNYHNLYFYEYLTPFVIISSLSVYLLFQQIVLKENILSRLSNLTLGIYLIHAGILELVFSFIHKTSFVVFENPIFRIPLISAITLFFSIVSVKGIANIKYLKRII